MLKSPCNGNYRMNSCRCNSSLEELRVNFSFWQSMKINLIWLFCKAWNWLLLLVHKETEHWPVGYHGGRQTIGGPRPLAGIVAWVFLRSAGWHRRHNNKERCSQCFLMKWFCAEALGHRILSREYICWLGEWELFLVSSLSSCYGRQVLMSNHIMTEKSMDSVIAFDVSYVSEGI